MDRKEQLEPVPLRLPLHEPQLDLDEDGKTRKRSKHSSLLPAINQLHHHPPSSFSNFSSLRPHSADSSTPRPPLLPPPSSSFLPLFSSTHRITAAGNIVHLTQAELDALTSSSLTSSLIQSRRSEGVGSVGGRERVILLEPLTIQAKVDTGLHSTPIIKEDEDEPRERRHLDAAERRRRRRERTDERRRERLRQREERAVDLAHHHAEENKEQMEEKIQPEQPSTLPPPPPPPLSPTSQLRRLQTENAARQRQMELYDSLTSHHAVTGDELDVSSAVMSAAIQVQVNGRVRGQAHARVEGGDEQSHHTTITVQQHKGVQEWLQKRGQRNNKPYRVRSKPSRDGDDVLLWSDHHPHSIDSEGPNTWMSTMSIVVDRAFSDSDSSSSNSDADDSDSSSSSSHSPHNPEHDTSLTAEERVIYALHRREKHHTRQVSRPTSSSLPSSTSRPSTSSPRSRSSSRPTSPALPKRHRKRVTYSQAGQVSEEVRRKGKKVKGGGRSKAEVEEELERVKQNKGRKSVLFDQSPVVLEGGDTIQRESVYMHHARDVQLIVELLMEAQGGGLNLSSPITVQSVKDRGMGGERGEGRDGEGKGVEVMLTTVMHGKDMMIVIKWLTTLATHYILTHLNPPSPPSHPLDQLSLDRRSLYNTGLTHERIDQIYSGLYSYSTGFFHLLEGLVKPHVQEVRRFMHRLWVGYRRLLEVGQPGLYQWVMECMRRVGKEESEELYQSHVKEVERSQALVKGRREEVQQLKDEFSRTHELYEDTLDGVSEARVTVMSLQEMNYREEQQLLEISDESIMEMTAKAQRAMASQQAVSDESVRVRERRAQTVKAIQQARADLHLARLHHDDMHRLIGERRVINTELEQAYPPLLERVEEAEKVASETARVSLTVAVLSFQHLCYNQQVQAVIDAQTGWVKGAKEAGLMSVIGNDVWHDIRNDIERAYATAQHSLTQHVKGDVTLDGLVMSEVESAVQRMVESIDPLTEEQKKKLGLLHHEHEHNQRVEAAQLRHSIHSTLLTQLTTDLSTLSSNLTLVHDSYRTVYLANDAIITSNTNLQSQIDTLLSRLAVLLPTQSTTRSSIAFTRNEIASFIHQCETLPIQIASLRQSITDLIPRQTELNSVETAKGEVYRSLLNEKDKLDVEFSRAVRDGEELKGEVRELEDQLKEMEEKAKPTYRELDGKLGVLERELEFKTREWENLQMRRCEEEQKLTWRVEAVNRAIDKLRPRQSQLKEAQAEADAVRAILDAERVVHEGIRLEMRETREQMQAKTKEKEEFLAQHIAQSHALMEVRGKAVGHIAHLRDVLEHTKSELRAAGAVNEQMGVGFEKRLQQWKGQLEARKEATRKKKEIDQQRKDVQMIKRKELNDSIDAVKSEHEVEDEKRRELMERVEMMRQELAGEVEKTKGMVREKERLERFHSELSLAAPHLERELQRVMEKEREWDVREVERLIGVELDKREELMRRVAVLEEDEWHRMSRKSERWIQTDPSRHFKPINAEMGEERFIIGRELGLMTDNWVKEKQQHIKQQDAKEEADRTNHHHTHTHTAVILPSPALIAALGTTSSASTTTASVASSGVPSPSSSEQSWAESSSSNPSWSASLRSSSRAPPPPPQSGVRRRAGSVVSSQTQPELGAEPGKGWSARVETGGGGGGGGRGGRGRRAIHARTQSSMPANWHNAPAVSMLSRIQSADGERDRKVESKDEQMEERSGAVASSTVRRVSGVSPEPKKSLPAVATQRGASRSMSPLPPSPLSPSSASSRAARSPSAPSRPLTASSLPEVAEFDGGDGSLTHSPLPRSRTRSPLAPSHTLDRPGSAFRSTSPLLWSGSRPTTAASLESRESTGGLSRPRTAERSRSPVSPWGGVEPNGLMDAQAMIPQTAMRPPSRHHPAITPLHHPLPLPTTSPSPSLDEVHAMTARTFNIQQHRRATQDEHAQALDAHHARTAEQAYQHFVASSTHTPPHKPRHASTQPINLSTASRAQPEVATVDVKEAALATSDVPTSVSVMEGAMGGGESGGGVGRRAHRGAVHMATTAPMAGTLSEWLELQVRSAVELEDDEKRRRQAAASVDASPPHHHHLSLMMPDPLQPVPRPQPAVAPPPVTVIQPPTVLSPRVLISPRRVALSAAPSLPPPPPPPPSMLDAQVAASPALLPPAPSSPLVSPVYSYRAMSPPPAPVMATGHELERARSPPLLATRRVVGRGIEVPEDEQPGRVPAFVKRSIRQMYQNKK